MSAREILIDFLTVAPFHRPAGWHEHRLSYSEHISRLPSSPINDNIAPFREALRRCRLALRRAYAAVQYRGLGAKKEQGGPVRREVVRVFATVTRRLRARDFDARLLIYSLDDGTGVALWCLIKGRNWRDEQVNRSTGCEKIGPRTAGRG